MSFFVRNTTGSDIEINDLGLTIEVGVDLDLRSEPPNAIAISEDLRDFITAGDILVLDPADSSTELSTVDSFRVIDRTNTAPYGVVVGSTLKLLEDVSIENPINDYVLTYDLPNTEWQAKPSQGGGGPGGDSSSVRESVTQINHNFSTGQAVYYDGTQYQLAKADDVNTLATGVVEVTGTDNFDYVTDGDITTMSGLTAGEWYYTSSDTLGAITTIEPQQFSNPVGYAKSPTHFHFVSIRAMELNSFVNDTNVVRKRLVVQNNHGFITTNAVYFAADGLYKLALADNVSTLSTGLVEVIDVNSFYYVTDGDIVVSGAPGLIQGQWYYLDDIVPGKITTVEPQQFSNPVGYMEINDFHVVSVRAVELTTAVNPNTDKKIITQISHGFIHGQPIFFNGNTNLWQLAQANSSDTLGTEICRYIDDDTFEAVLSGNLDGFSLIQGDWYYVDPSSPPGQLTNITPISGFSNPVGVAESSSVLSIIPYRAIEYT